MYSKITAIFDLIHTEKIQRALQVSGHCCFILKEVKGRDHSSPTVDKYQLQALMQLEIYLSSDRSAEIVNTILEVLNVDGDEETLVSVLPLEKVFLNGRCVD
ncbi:hypothetical protein [Vibrio sp. F74]|uniref:hypothetical protein n=1 Tax=Vibrio sp. F74 TaxID=700020 RepID=UPI0035F5CCA9